MSDQAENSSEKNKYVPDKLPPEEREKQWQSDSEDYGKGAKNDKWKQNLLRIPKGVSGNPNGNKKQRFSSRKIIQMFLDMREDFYNPITKQMENLSQGEIMTIAILNKARKGSVTHYNALLDRLEGRPDINVKQEVTSRLIAKIVKDESTLPIEAVDYDDEVDEEISDIMDGIADDIKDELLPE